MNPLSNPYVRMFGAAILSSWLAPKIVDRYINGRYTADSASDVILTDEDDVAADRDAQIKRTAAIGLTAAMTSTLFIGIGMMLGESATTAAAKGPA